MVPESSVWGDYYPTQAFGQRDPRQLPPAWPGAMTAAAPGLGEYFASPPAAMARRRQMEGLGAHPSSSYGLGLGAGVGFGMMAVGIGVVMIVQYQLGKAMAPNPKDEKTWAWSNAIVGTLFPPFTLGMAVYKNYFR